MLFSVQIRPEALRLMNSCFNVYGLVALLVFYAGLVRQVPAQTFQTLHSFNASDGANPYAGSILSSNILYGTTLSGGFGIGTVFALNTNGTGFTTVHNFAGWDINGINGEGAHPFAGLTLSGNTLYGTATYGGSYGNGTIFSVNADGTGFTNIHNFTNSDGANPVATLISSGNTLFGTAPNGGSSGNGTLFAMKTDGTVFTVLHTFTPGSADPSDVYTNRDGIHPWGRLVLSANTLYGTAADGGSYGSGTIFAVHTDGSGFTVLHAFTTTYSSGAFTNRDGANPAVGLTLSGNTLYGTAAFGGSYGNGTIFSVHTDGTGFATLHNFTTISSPSYTNSDGASPQSEILISGNRMFGSARLRGRSGYGTVFAINIDGTDFTTLHDFTAPPVGFPHTNADGYFPSGGLVLSGSVLYGTARSGGSYSGNGDPDGNGTIFSISLPVSPPRLTVMVSGDNLILAWQTNYAGFDYSGYILQSTTNFASPLWTTNLPAPVVTNGQCTVTNPFSGSQQFFRLSK
jgi:uncharacterized repeat protein (TIGR03803 family)